MIKYKVNFSKQAEKQIEDIFFYISLDNESKAKTFINEMINFFNKRLTELPLSCQKVKGEIRILPYKRYGVLFLVNEKEMIVKVLHIFTGGQDWGDWL
jgi:plasmid stabilization system protein ParE